tara:strand:- start:138 stop:305 length:168 start_codon:yes stop_codon:yes gene_type:complete
MIHNPAVRYEKLLSAYYALEEDNEKLNHLIIENDEKLVQIEKQLTDLEPEFIGGT